MKPINKQEGRWYYWRSETFFNPKKGFARFAKKQIAKARRRFEKQELDKLIEIEKKEQ